MEVKVNNEDIEIVVAVTDIISVVLELPIETTPVENFCDTVDDCLGIEPSNGDPDKYLNQQGNWETITVPPSFIESVDNTATINLSVSSGELTADFASMNISQFTNDSGYLSGVPTLQDVTDSGNTTDNNIQFDDGAGVYFNNGSKVTEGTTDSGLGGNKGVSLKCSIDYELKWEAGRLYTLEQDGFTIRELSHNFTFTPTVNDDDTKGFVIGSRWILDNGDVYVCSDATTGAAVWNLIIVGTVTSVGLSMPSAFNVANSPITTSGTINVTGAGVASQYVRGDGTLANFPTNVGGGSSVSYYLNGSVNQGTFGGTTYYEMSRTANTGAGVNFTINANGYVASFITSAGDPALLNIPAGNWDFQIYFSASSSGGSPQFYTELYKYNGTTFTLISSGSTAPQNITNGTFADVYSSTLTVPTTTLSLTDRLAVRIYVLHSGRTITMYTQDNRLAEVHTTFSTGLAALNGLTTQVQYLSTGTSGTDFNISSATDTHTFNLPIASGTNTGKLSSTDWTTFNNKQAALGFTPENVANKSTTTTLGTSDTLYPTQNAVKTYVDNQVAGVVAPLSTLDLFNDFTGYTTEQRGSALTIIDDFGLHTIASGIWVVGTAENGRSGILNLYSYSNNSPQSNYIWTNPVTNGNDTTGTTTFTAEFKLRDNLSAAGKPYIITCGLTSRATNANLKLANGYGVYFDYTHSVNGGKFQCVSSNNGSNTALDSGITAALNTWYKVSIVLTNTQALYYINGVLVRTINTNIPAAGIAGAMQLECTTSSFTVIGFAIDYMRIQKTGLSR